MPVGGDVHVRLEFTIQHNMDAIGAVTIAKQTSPNRYRPQVGNGNQAFHLLGFEVKEPRDALVGLKEFFLRGGNSVHLFAVECNAVCSFCIIEDRAL